MELVDSCPACKSANIKKSIKINNMPVYCNVLWDTQSESTNARKGNIHLAYCNQCGHIFNCAFDIALMDYTEDYENSLHFSAKFNEYADDLANRLVKKYNVRNKVIVEIGCGKGDFLRTLCEKGDNTGYGFDKSYDRNRQEHIASQNIQFYQDYFGEKYSNLNPALICCRHVLEHIEDPYEFLVDLRRIVADRNNIIYFEVPNVVFTLKDMGIWDLIYEHCGYFSKSSLENIFHLAGYEICEVGESFGGQFLYIEVKSAKIEDKFTYSSNEDLLALSKYVAEFETNYNNKLGAGKQLIDSLGADNKWAVVWGAGSKGVTFLNVMPPNDCIKYVIDINPHKHSKYIPGTAQQVRSPNYLKTSKPDKIIVMNPLYVNEISDSIESMGLDIDVISV